MKFTKVQRRVLGTIVFFSFTFLLFMNFDRVGGKVTPRIVNGVPGDDFPEVAAFLVRGTFDHDFNLDTPDKVKILMNCTGTLISCNHILTAGHCVEGDLNSWRIFIPSAGIFKVIKKDRHPNYDGNSLGNDLAILTLDRPVEGVKPAMVNTKVAVKAGLEGVIVGYGRLGGYDETFGLKMMGKVRTRTCPKEYRGKSRICWDFTEGAAGQSSNTCNGDSGGPLFLKNKSEVVLAGVTSSGERADCMVGDMSLDTDVSKHLSFIRGVVPQKDWGQACGSLSPIGDGRAVSRFINSTSSGDNAIYEFDVQQGAKVLRVGLNGKDSFFRGQYNNYDIYVRQGSAPDDSSFDCKSKRKGVFEFCEIKDPKPGPWYVSVKRVQSVEIEGAPLPFPYQVTTTLFY